MGEYFFPGNIKFWIGGLSGIVALLGYLISGIVLISNISTNVEENRVEMGRIVQRLNDLDVHGTRVMAERLGIMGEHLLTLDRRENARNTEIERVARELEGRVASGDDATRKHVQELANRLTGWEITLKQFDIINTRQIDVIRRVENLEKQTQSLSDLKSSIDLERSEIKRMDEQQSRIIQALDNTYNTLQEALRGQTITRQPTPGNTPPF